MKILPIFILLMFFAGNSFGQSCGCFELARIVAPVISENTRKVYEEKLAEAKKDFEKNPNSADAIIWLGRRTAYLGDYREAIEIFNAGIKKFPQDARFYRHRGHRYLTMRCFDEAIGDFETAAKLVKGKKDEIEPDGLPNARNIPTSTLQSNIFYHLGLAYYLNGDFTNALKAYRECEKVSKNADMLVATKHWLYMTLRRLGRERAAANSIAKIRYNLDIIENDDYHKLIKLYQGRLSVDSLLNELGAEANTLSNASLGYGIGNWFLYNGEKKKAEKVFRQIVSGDQWASFGFAAAEREIGAATFK